MWGMMGKQKRKWHFYSMRLKLSRPECQKTTALLLEMDDIDELKIQLKELNQKRTELQTTIDNMRRKASLTDKELPSLKILT